MIKIQLLILTLGLSVLIAQAATVEEAMSKTGRYQDLLPVVSTDLGADELPIPR